MNTSAATRMVAAREIRAKLRDKTFLWSTVFFMVFGIGGTFLPVLLNSGPDTVAVADAGTASTLEGAGLDVRRVADDRAAEQLVRAGDADAAVVSGPKILAMEDSPRSVVLALSNPPPVELLDPDTVDPVVAYLVPMCFVMVFFFTSLTFGLQIAQSVTEEKQTRIVEILVAAVPVRALLAGKVIAGVILALTQIVLFATVTAIGSQFSEGGRDLLPLLAPAIGWFVPFFVVGFVMLAALWAAVGALVNRQEDISGASTPVTMVTIVPFLAVLFLANNTAAMAWLSYIPFSSPTAMPLRMFSGDAAPWEPIVSIAVLAVTAFALLLAGARVYEGSLLRTNGRTSVATAWRDRETRRLAELGSDR